VLALGFIFAPFTFKTFIFAGVAVVIFIILSWITPHFFKLYGNRPSELEANICSCFCLRSARWRPGLIATPCCQHTSSGLCLQVPSGLTFGTISALFGFSYGIIDQAQYTAVVAGVVASAVVPTLIANAFFLPHHLLPSGEPDPMELPSAVPSPTLPKET
jgi:hypothetical protein